MVIEDELKIIEKEAKQLMESLPAFAQFTEYYSKGEALLCRISELNKRLGVKSDG